MTRYLRVRLGEDLEAKLQRAVTATGRSPSELVRHAIATLPIVAEEAPALAADAPADEVEVDPLRAKAIARRTDAENAESLRWAVAHLLRVARSKVGVDAQSEQVAGNAMAVLDHFARPVPAAPAEPVEVDDGEIRVMPEGDGFRLYVQTTEAGDGVSHHLSGADAATLRDALAAPAEPEATEGENPHWGWIVLTKNHSDDEGTFWLPDWDGELHVNLIEAYVAEQAAVLALGRADVALIEALAPRPAPVSATPTPPCGNGEPHRAHFTAEPIPGVPSAVCVRQQPCPGVSATPTEHVSPQGWRHDGPRPSPGCGPLCREAAERGDPEPSANCAAKMGSRPWWMSPDQYDPCRCDLPAGHEPSTDDPSGHSCEHVRPATPTEERS